VPPLPRMRALAGACGLPTGDPRLSLPGLRGPDGAALVGALLGCAGRREGRQSRVGAAPAGAPRPRHRAPLVAARPRLRPRPRACGLANGAPAPFVHAPPTRVAPSPAPAVSRRAAKLELLEQCLEAEAGLGQGLREWAAACKGCPVTTLLRAGAPPQLVLRVLRAGPPAAAPEAALPAPAPAACWWLRAPGAVPGAGPPPERCALWLALGQGDTTLVSEVRAPARPGVDAPAAADRETGPGARGARRAPPRSPETSHAAPRPPRPPPLPPPPHAQLAARLDVTVTYADGSTLLHRCADLVADGRPRRAAMALLLELAPAQALRPEDLIAHPPPLSAGGRGGGGGWGGPRRGAGARRRPLRGRALRACLAAGPAVTRGPHKLRTPNPARAGYLTAPCAWPAPISACAATPQAAGRRRQPGGGLDRRPRPSRPHGP
jgi:hypothetical protein